MVKEVKKWEYRAQTVSPFWQDLKADEMGQLLNQ
jgi:hypothetical protein